MPHPMVEIALGAGSGLCDRPRCELQSLLVERLLLRAHVEDSKSQR